MQMIFQDPKASLNPRRRIKDIIAEPLLIWSATDRGSIDGRVADLMRQVGLNTDVATRRPSELSGGQCQRVGIARALANGPQLLVGDEPVSALDVSVQAQILNLLRRTGRDNGLSMLFISHDLGVVKNLADRVMVLYLGRVCEIGSAAEIFDRPLHPYTRLLMASSRPGVDTADMAVSTETPSPLAPPSGCRFRTRCPFAEEKCATSPELRQLGPDHQVACHFADRWQEPSASLAGSGATARVLVPEVPPDGGNDHG
jgi:oligopeptide/dipeptide ABC transporter ATP-binding protein